MRELFEAITLRLRSPIFGYYVLASAALNWKPLFYLIVSIKDPIDRIKYFEEHTNLDSILWHPLLLAAIFAVAYPWVQLILLKIVQIPTRLRNNIHAENEHSHLQKKLELERLRGKLVAEEEMQLIERAKRDEKVEEVVDPNRKEDLRRRLNQLRQEKYGSKNLELLEATKHALEVLNIETDNLVTTGGSTGIRVWLSKEVPQSTLNLLHEEIVAYHGKPVALDVRDYLSDKTIFRQERPQFLQGNGT